MMKKLIRITALLLALVTLLSFPASADTSMYYQELLSHEKVFTISASSPYTFSVSLPSRPSTDLFFITECYSPPTFSWGNYQSVVVWTSGRYACHVLTVNNVNAGTYNITCSTNDPDTMGIRLFSVFFKRFSTSVSLKPASVGFASYITESKSLDLPNTNASVYNYPSAWPYTYTSPPPSVGVYYRYTDVYIDASSLAGLDSVSVSFKFTSPASGSIRLSMVCYSNGALIDCQPFYVSTTGKVVPFSYDQYGEIGTEDDSSGIYGCSFTPPASGSVVVRVMVNTTIQSTYTISFNAPSGVFTNNISEYEFRDKLLNLLEVDLDEISALLSVIHSDLQQTNSILSDFKTNVGVLFGNLHVWLNEYHADLTEKLQAWFNSVADKLDQLIGGTTEGDELSQGSEELENQISDVHDFEQSQQEILDNSLPEMQQAVSVAGFSSALAFVQRYINMAWLGIFDFQIIYLLPIFIGLFFFICGRLPGVTRWSYRPPKGGGSK